MEYYLHSDASSSVPLRRDICQKATNLYLASISLEDIEKAIETKPDIDPASKLPVYYYDFLDVFNKAKANKLALYRDYNYKIELKASTTPPSGPLYNIAEDKLRVLRKYLKE